MARQSEQLGFPSLSPTGAAPVEAGTEGAPASPERVEAEVRLQAIEKRLNQVAMDIIKAVPYSSRKAELQREYDALQAERSELQRRRGVRPR